MMNRKNLLSIGEMSKYTGAGIKSLRYYEQIGILKPSYVDPDSGYRYYSHSQTYLVDFILFCIELDIPLKELTRFIDADDMVDYLAFLSRAREIAGKKMKQLKLGLKLIKHIEQNLDLASAYQNRQVYSREFQKKILYVKTIGNSLKDIDETAWADLFVDMPYYENDNMPIPDYGLMCEHSPTGVIYHAFVEVQSHVAKRKENIKIIPQGKYFCSQSESSQIEQAPDIFKEQLACVESFFAIEIEIFSGKYRINAPINELRIVPQK